MSHYKIARIGGGSHAFFRQVFPETATAYPDVRSDFASVDAMSMSSRLGLPHGAAAVTAAADRIDTAVAWALTDSRSHPRDIGGTASTRRCADSVIEALY
ncbi:MAG TPA: hypothetical protein VID28_22210 [Methylomirabilota bacterium]